MLNNITEIKVIGYRYPIANLTYDKKILTYIENVTLLKCCVSERKHYQQQIVMQ